ncbi:hypothetical protein JCM10908_003623 [Rhodotorula pacifica]|uniref:uncharacterized protein n=1 Tax=Rhodotorula pacifica TaxID=1495444 RepID=UPI00317EBE8C
MYVSKLNFLSLLGEIFPLIWSFVINAYGTVGGLIVGSFFNMLIVLFQPEESAAFIGGQLAVAHMYMIAVFVRNIMGSASDGTNGMQKWHAEFAFLLGSSITGVVVPAVLSDPHHIHGFSSRAEMLTALRNRQDAANLKRNNPDLISDAVARREGANEDCDKHLERRFAPRVRRVMQQTRKGVGRYQAEIIFAAFAASELIWFVANGATIWWGKETKFWQSQCDEMIGTGSDALIQGVSFTFVSLAFLFTLFLIIPVFHPTSRYKSAAHFIVLLFSHHVVNPRETIQSVQRRGRNLHKRLSQAPHSPLLIGAAPEPASSKAETTVRVGLSLAVWTLWFICIMVILFKALEDFLLVGATASAAWPYAAIQNFMFGCFPLAKFFLKPVREHLRKTRKARRNKPTGDQASHVPAVEDPEADEGPSPPPSAVPLDRSIVNRPHSATITPASGAYDIKSAPSHRIPIVLPRRPALPSDTSSDESSDESDSSAPLRRRQLRRRRRRVAGTATHRATVGVPSSDSSEDEEHQRLVRRSAPRRH